MHLGKLGRGLAAMTVIVTLTAACTPDPGLTPPPTPSAPASPTETEQQRQERVAYEAAEKSYRTFRKAMNRVLASGGANQPSPEMLKAAAGPYLAEYTSLIKSFKKGQFHQEGSEKILSVVHNGYSPSAVILDVCEDSRSIKTVRSDGSTFGKGELRTARLEVRKKDGTWKVWSGDGEKATSCS